MYSAYICPTTIPKQQYLEPFSNLWQIYSFRVRKHYLSLHKCIVWGRRCWKQGTGEELPNSQALYRQAEGEGGRRQLNASDPGSCRTRLLSRPVGPGHGFKHSMLLMALFPEKDWKSVGERPRCTGHLISRNFSSTARSFKSSTRKEPDPMCLNLKGKK